MEQVYNAIKFDIKSQTDVNLSILGRVSDWKRSHYVILSDIISDHLMTSPLMTKSRILNLGSTISPITLQRFFENDYQVKTHNDLRFIKTLDKLCVFLGKFDLNTYIHESLNDSTEPNNDPQTDLDFFEKKLVLDYCKSQYDALKDLPLIDVSKFSDLVSDDSPLSERIRLHLEEKKKNNLVFVTKNNRSNYEIFDIKKICDDSELKVIKTQEFWNLVFKDDLEKNYVVNHLNTQYYFIKKTGEEWKIWDNYNPDYGLILKQTESR